MGRPRNLLGQRFGRWLVLEKASNSHSGRTRWLCQCDCGNKKIVPSYALLNGDSQSCGCRSSEIHKQKCIDLTGKKFGRWTVLSRAENTGRDATTWLCRCECGTERIVNGINLRSGTTKSCGCLSFENISKRNVEYFKKRSLVGKRFGKLVVIERTDERKRHLVVYKCKCDCGNIYYALGSKLTEGSVQSCGCLLSKGEELVAKILRENNIPFTKQKTFDDCRSPLSNSMLRFDFWINESYLLEYDGLQHFKNVSFGKESLGKRKYLDELKNQYCKKKCIPLIRIPYTQFDTLCINDLLLEKSKFVI